MQGRHILAAIGNTPLVELRRIVPTMGLKTNFALKN